MGEEKNAFILIADHLKKYGWPTKDSDHALLDNVYETWVKISPVCNYTKTLDSNLLSDMILNAMIKKHDNESCATCLSALLVMSATLRARNEGHLQRGGSA